MKIKARHGSWLIFLVFGEFSDFNIFNIILVSEQLETNHHRQAATTHIPSRHQASVGRCVAWWMFQSCCYPRSPSGKLKVRYWTWQFSWLIYDDLLKNMWFSLLWLCHKCDSLPEGIQDSWHDQKVSCCWNCWNRQWQWHLKSPEKPSLKSLRVRKCQVNRKQPVVTHPNKTHSALGWNSVWTKYCSYMFFVFFPKLTLAVLQVLQVAVSA